MNNPLQKEIDACEVKYNQKCGLVKTVDNENKIMPLGSSLDIEDRPDVKEKANDCSTKHIRKYYVHTGKWFWIMLLIGIIGVVIKISQDVDDQGESIDDGLEVTFLIFAFLGYMLIVLAIVIPLYLVIYFTSLNKKKKECEAGEGTYDKTMEELGEEKVKRYKKQQFARRVFKGIS